MKFLLDKGISQEVIDKLRIKYDESILDIVDLEEGNVVEVIDYLKSIGVKDIETLLIYNISIFTTEVDEIKAAFEKQNIPAFVDEINDDITIIDML